ncbi:MAG: hypothetical protein ACRD10_10970 [Terriglobia bacterium]
MNHRWFVLTALLAVFLAPMSTFANGTIDFVVPWANGGTLSYSGGTSPLMGQNIQVADIFGYGGTQNNFDAVRITDGLLDFSSGSSSGRWSWGSGGSLDVTGSIGSISGTLLHGTFSDVYLRRTSLGWLELSLGSFSGSISSGLSAFYGFPTGSVDGSLRMLAFNDVPAGQAFNDAPVLVGAVQTVDAAEGGGLAATLCLLLTAGLCLTLGVRLKVLKLAA